MTCQSVHSTMKALPKKCHFGCQNENEERNAGLMPARRSVRERANGPDFISQRAQAARSELHQLTVGPMAAVCRLVSTRTACEMQ